MRTVHSSTVYGGGGMWYSLRGGIRSLGMALEGDWVWSWGYGPGKGYGPNPPPPPPAEQTHLVGGSKYQGLKNQFDD